MIAHATHPINIDVDGFIGRYKINFGGHNTGNKIFNLSEGMHQLYIINGGSVAFTVNGDGTVVSSDTSIMTHAGSTLTFNNRNVNVNIGDYNNVFTISLSSNQLIGGMFSFPVNIEIAINLPTYFIAATFKVNPEGYVVVTSGSDRIIGLKDEIKFKLVKIKMDSRNYDGWFAFIGRPYMSGITYHYLLPNSPYTIRTNSADVIATFETSDMGVVSQVDTHHRAEGNTVYLYNNRYTITPPVGYAGVWQVYGQGNSTGIDSKWLLVGLEARFYASGGPYYFTADSDCASFNLVTSVGTFNFECEDASSLVHDLLDEDALNSRQQGFILNRTDGRLSTSIGDYSMTVNGSSHSLANASLSNDTLEVADAFVEGRNAVVLDGEDEDSATFQITPVFWAGSAEVEIETTGATDTVTLNVEQTIGMNTYDIDIVKDAVDYKVVFQNVPQIDDGIITITSSRGMKKVFRSKISKFEKIKL